jgi:hypothetical protein
MIDSTAGEQVVYIPSCYVCALVLDCLTKSSFPPHCHGLEPSEDESRYSSFRTLMLGLGTPNTSLPRNEVVAILVSCEIVVRFPGQ